MAKLCRNLGLFPGRIALPFRLFSNPKCAQSTEALHASNSAGNSDGDIFTAEHVELRKSLGKLIERDINPYVDEWEANEQFPAHEIFKKLGDAGFLGVTKPTEYGGLGLDFTFSLAVALELGKINCGGIPMAIGVQSDMATPALARFGSDELKEEFLRPTVAGDVVACLGVSEATAGSDVANIKTTAVKKGDDYIINGSKMWITNGHQADWICLLANTNDGPAHKNKSLFCLPMSTKGVIRAKKIEKIGMKCSDTAQLFFEDVVIPKKFIIGQEGAGFMYQMMQFQEERMWGSAVALEPLDRLIRDTIEYTGQRMAFGKSILSNQCVHFRLAELQTEIELLRSLMYRTIGMYAKGTDVTNLASMCKLKSGRLAREVTDSCMQYWGGMGFTNEVLVSRFYRDFRLLSIGGGADEVMLSIICKHMKTLPGQGK
ncbi:probable acyl-CoA dehydrogenase 6 [Antedon mediterranea]|uniref:probable acyl-CoA dehydrogenase 6 n=1 Tax=Antedon mediterranea TaxID=105859 RepID=UPI003AF42EBB